MSPLVFFDVCHSWEPLCSQLREREKGRVDKMSSCFEGPFMTYVMLEMTYVMLI